MTAGATGDCTVAAGTVQGSAAVLQRVRQGSVQAISAKSPEGMFVRTFAFCAPPQRRGAYLEEYSNTQPREDVGEKEKVDKATSASCIVARSTYRISQEPSKVTGPVRALPPFLPRPIQLQDWPSNHEPRCRIRPLYSIFAYLHGAC